MRSVIPVVFVSAMATACVSEADVNEAEESTRTQGVLEGNQIATNGIATNGVALNGIATNGIATNQISNNLYLIASTNLLSTTEGRDILKYVVSCAIPKGVTLIGEHQSVTYEFDGDIGLAPAWIERGLRESEQRWVSACLISRVNRFGVPVSISIRGSHPALKVSVSEARDYKVQEGAFFGNVFRAVDEPIIWNACRGEGQAAGDSGTLDLRDCAEPDPANPGQTLCGFKYAGDCADWTRPVNAYSCERYRKPARQKDDDDDRKSRDDDGGHYEKCHDSAGFGRWPHSERYTEVITVYLKP